MTLKTNKYNNEKEQRNSDFCFGQKTEELFTRKINIK